MDILSVLSNDKGRVFFRLSKKKNGEIFDAFDGDSNVKITEFPRVPWQISPH